MPVQPTYPGVYIEEVPSGVRAITGVATSITAFVGRAMRGPVNKATTINSYGDFEREFGGLWLESKLGFSVRDFYLNGGSQAIIARLFHPTFATEAERQKADEAAKAVAAAATGADAAAAAAAARAKANTYAQKTAAEMTAADVVAKGAEGAVNANATADSVKKAAEAAVPGAAPYAKAKLKIGEIKLEAAYEGKWGANLRVTVKPDVSEEVAQRMGLTKADLFNLTVRDTGPGGVTERFLNLTLVKGKTRSIDKVLEAESKLVRWDGELPDPPPVLQIDDDGISDDVTTKENDLADKKKALEDKQNADPNADTTQEKKAVDDAKKALADAKKAMEDAVSDGLPLKILDFLPDKGEQEKKGMYTLEQADLFNLLCLPPYNGDDNVDTNLISAAASYCEKRRAMLLVDAPSSWKDKKTAIDEFKAEEDKIGTRSKNAALFFPRFKQPNPLKENQKEDFAPSGVIAGVFARTDTQRGVWKAPAGLEAALVGVPELSVPLTDAENGELNPLGINCLRAMPAAGRVIWGARTLQGDDRLASEWKYIPIRRLALFIEESLYRGTQWVVFEPNDEPLWTQIRFNVGAFMQNLFRQGAFQGSSPREAYFVKCDKETTTQNDINIGIVNIMVGFAPLKPAEFVIIKIQQMAGRSEA